uniref:N-acetylneuraminic acid synthase a n=1 Tax=Oncorhynchus kisutch TaxID=8019 RepID=A0A8C7MAY4_ONCKI
MPLKISSLKGLCPGRMFGGSNPCFIIAEIGQNHQGDIEIAKKMTKMAKDCGTDCAKFQKSELEYKFNKRALERPYTSKHSWGKTYERHTVTTSVIWSSVMNSIESSRNMGVGIFFTASGMDEVAVDFLDELDEPFFKVASCDANKVTLGIQAKEFNLGFIRPENHVSHSGCHVPFTEEWLPSVHSTIKAKFLECCRDGPPISTEELWRSFRVTIGFLVTSLTKALLPRLLSLLRKSVVSKVVIPKGTVLSMDMLGVKVGEPGGISPASRNVWWMATTTRAESTRCAFVQQDTTLWNVQIERCYVKQTC